MQKDLANEYHLACDLIFFLSFLVVTAYLYSRTFDSVKFEKFYADLYGILKFSK